MESTPTLQVTTSCLRLCVRRQKGRQLTHWDIVGAVGAASLPGALPRPHPCFFTPQLRVMLLVRLFRGRFYILFFEAHPFLVAQRSLLPAEQKDANNTKYKKQKAEKKAWASHIVNTQPRLNGSLVMRVWIPWRLCTWRSQGRGVKRTGFGVW